MGERAYLVKRPKELFSEVSHNNKKEIININKSFYFLLPLTGLSVRDPRIKNTYIIYKGDYDLNYIYVQVHETVEDLKYGEKVEDFLYKVPLKENFKNEFELFLSGEYSKYSIEAKMVICKDEAGDREVSSTIAFSILNKLPSRREYIENLVGQSIPKDAEVCSIYSVEGESYERSCTS